MFRHIFKSVPDRAKGFRNISTSTSLYQNHSCKLLVVGGGSGGCSVSAKFTRDLGKDKVIVLEPADLHYYQPLFTLAGGGIKKLSQSSKLMRDVLPKNALWVKDSAVQLDVKNNKVTTAKGDTIKYDFLLIAVGLQLNYDKIPGLIEGLNKYENVGSIYSPKYVEKMFKALTQFEKGNAVFTFPNSPVKCPGAPQKICYISENYLQKVGKRNQANVIYNTSLPVIFGVKKYADALWKVVQKRNIKVNLRMNLIQVKPDKNIAVFQNLDKPEETNEIEYSLLHATPPMSTPEVLHNCKELVNENGFVDVNKDTLQHVKYPNIFAIGDCASSPNSKTAAAVAAQSPVVYRNLKAIMEGKEQKSVYDGYASCPLVTGYGKCIMAEFDYNLTPLETFPISQDREMYLMYLLKKEFMPALYWNVMLNGYWNGPAFFRNIMHLKLF